jgi:nucleoside-diphosphate-sugar epimerase
MRRTEADVTRAREQLGYRPSVGMEEGIRRTVAWHVLAAARIPAAVD